MQNYKPDLNDPVEITFSQLIEKINNNNESLRSNFSGESEPENFCVGQLFYNTSTEKLILKTESDNFEIMTSGSAELHSHTNKEILDNIINAGSGAIITTDERSKLANIEANANNYTHPSSHSASIIDETQTRVFVTPAEKNRIINTVKIISNNYTMSSNDTFILINTENEITVTLPNATLCAGYIFIIKRNIFDDAGSAIINCVSNQKISNETSIQIDYDECITLISDANNFLII